MHPRIALPLVLLFASGCAQVPSSGEGALEERASAAQQQPSASVAAAPRVADAAPAVAVTPRLQPAEELATSEPKTAEPDGPSKSLWPRITRGFAMAPMDNDLVREWENWYASRPDYVARMIDRSSRFLFHVVEQHEKHNMPMELALLPMIESAYNPVAYSRSHASSIWQLIPSTDDYYG